MATLQGTPTLQETLRSLLETDKRFAKHLLIKAKISRDLDPLTTYTNCLGTALSDAWEKRKDTFVDPELKGPALLDQLTRIQKPQLGCFIAWIEKKPSLPSGYEVLHLGIVTSLDPLLITSRVHRGREFHENEPFEDLNRDFENEKGVEVVFYLPRHLKLKHISDAAKQADQGLKTILRAISPPGYLSKLDARAVGHEREPIRDDKQTPNEKVRNP